MKIPGLRTPLIELRRDVTSTAFRRTGYLRFHEAKRSDGNSVLHRELGVKQHGILSRTIRFFGGATKQDMADNTAIRRQFYHEFNREFPSFGDKMLEAVGFIKKNPETHQYELAHPTKPVSAGAVTKLLDVARANYAEDRDINDKGKEWKDTLSITGIDI